MHETQEQEKVIFHGDGHALINAVAGSGKTETLAQRVAELLSRGTRPEQILVLMFNRSAADEFRLRVAGQRHGQMPEISTFHAAGKKWLTLSGTRFAIDSTGVSKRAILAEIFARNGQHEDLDEVLDQISVLRNLRYPTNPVPPEIADDLAVATGVFKTFESLRIDRGVVGLDDLLHDAIDLFFSSDETAVRLLSKYTHVIVDEYQDVNPAQQWLLTRMASMGAQIMAAGDEDQCIYGWRGSDPGYMTRQFDRDFVDCARYTLTQTFRFGHVVSLMANHLSKFQGDRTDKLCLSSDASPRTEVQLFIGGGQEHHFISPPDNSALLAREYEDLDPFEWAWIVHGTPYAMEGKRVHERRSGAVLMHLLDHVGRRAGDFIQPPSKFSGVLFLRWFIGSRQVTEIHRLAADMEKTGWWQAMRDLFKSGLLPTHASTALALALNAMDRLRSSNDGDLLATVLTEANLSDRFEDICRLAGHLTISEFINRVKTPPPNTPRVIATSIHRAKGLGFDHVAVAGLQDPVVRYGRDSLRNIEEDRRLFYVAITRAKKSLKLFAPEDPRLSAMILSGSRIDIRESTPNASRFLFESLPHLCTTMGMALHDRSGVIPVTPVMRRYLHRVNETHPRFSSGLLSAIAGMGK